MRKKNRPTAASAIRYLKTSGEANANPCTSTASVPTPGDFEGSRPTPRKRSYSVRSALPFWGHSPFTLSPRVSSVERMRSPRAAGCFVRVGVRSKISVKSVNGAPRQQEGDDQPHRSPHHDLSPVGSIHQRLPATASHPRRAYRHRFATQGTPSCCGQSRIEGEGLGGS